jgi:hypothetical protein
MTGPDGLDDRTSDAGPAGAPTGAGGGPGPAAGGEPAETATWAAPRLLSRRADPLPLPPALHDAEVVASLHLKWAQLAGIGQGASPLGSSDASDAAGGGGGVRAKVRARVVAAARADAAADRGLIGDLIRAVDAVAARVDEVTARVGNLELLVQEVLDRLSEDLVRVQAALGGLDDRARDEPSRERGEAAEPGSPEGPEPT